MILSIPDEGYSRNASVPGFFPHRSCYERDDKLTPCLSEIKYKTKGHKQDNQNRLRSYTPEGGEP
jgi:hypothetical protein